jgi:CubicO group peptidase (beta-lactamase class C family)
MSRMADIQGTYDDLFVAVPTALAGLLDGGDVGGSVAVFVDGEPVVDIWGGYTDDSRTTAWSRDTIVNVWSTTKTMTALCALMLADAGEIDFGAPVSAYWPEFAAGGKDAVEVRHLMSHTAGLAGWTEPVTVEDLYDWDKVTALLAAQEPWWQPGTASGYHALTQGFLVGEVVRRVTGQSLGQFFAKEVAGPLGADFHIGLDAAYDDRVATLVPPPSLRDQIGALPAESLARRLFSNPWLDATETRDRAWRVAEIPAANGHGNARSVAAVQSVLAGGGTTRGVRLLSEAGCNRVFETQAWTLCSACHFGSASATGSGPRRCRWGRGRVSGVAGAAPSSSSTSTCAWWSPMS